MAYEFLAGKNIDLSRIGYKNAFLQFDFKEETSCLRITLFDNNTCYQDQITIDLEYEFGVNEQEDEDD